MIGGLREEGRGGEQMRPKYASTIAFVPLGDHMLPIDYIIMSTMPMLWANHAPST
jgi:hypothetical protein